ncbi:MAG TPA: hypothetical protein VF939_12515 [Puia sp.]
MYKSPRPGSWSLPLLFLMVIFGTFTLSGCHEGSEEVPINVDSVKSHVIPIQEAIMFTSKYRATVDSLNAKCPLFKDSFQIGHAEAFNRDSYRLLLKQKDSTGAPAAGIRIYYGLDEKGVLKLVLVPYDKNGNDIITHLISNEDKQVPGVSPAHTEALTVNSAQALETGQLCPPVCPPQTSVLNGQ